MPGRSRSAARQGTGHDGLASPRVMSASTPRRLITSTFMHAGLLHLGLNVYALYSIAPEAEAVLGYWPFAAVYLGSGLAGSVLCFLLTNSVTAGASGAVFGLIGAVALPRMSRRGGQRRRAGRGSSSNLPVERPLTR